ncbi:hypothetical protein GYMLUDRAFT_698421 [Collybiopsis luxurians FD-317 M1]|uniref:F-box domain-containing protein n=1 Tax=Collybiopsis luxurians FD-317 M1 TaxID=944289 RepID=A0A0D0BS72_9AGAR|nr:hypothetical protein GYMLUDRAFT_698421 [Collybiopsis luxurians FD-317 M1]
MSLSLPRALRVPELLQNIMEECDDRSNQQNVLVCKLWSETGLDLLWYKVTDLKRFLELFGKLKGRCRDADYKIEFDYAYRPSPASWRRFEKVYQTRIHIFSISYSDNQWIPALKTLATTRSNSAILPGLHTLEWNKVYGLGLGESALMFMHNSVHRFALIQSEPVPNPATLDDFTSFCEEVGSRMPFLSTLRLVIESQAEYQAPILALTRQLPNLEHLSIPPFEDPSEIPIGLGDKSLLCLEVLPMDQVSKYPFSSTLNISDPSTITLFSCLRELELHCSYDFAITFFQNVTSPGNIQRIALHSNWPETSDAVRNLIQCIAPRASQLTSFVLNFCNRKYEVLNSLLA